MRALLAQLEPVPGDLAANARRAEEIVAAADVELVVLPELWFSGYDLDRVEQHAIELDSPLLGSLRETAGAHATAVVVGFPERRGARVANAVALIDEHGELTEVYRKVQLFGDEQGVFEAGESLVLGKLAGLTVGPLICFDMEFPEHARELARAGAELLVTVAANMEPYYSDHLIASQSRALENRVAHLYCNRSGQEAGLKFVGGSRGVRSDGTIAEDAGEEERLLVNEVAPDRGGDDRVDYLALLRGSVGVKPTVVARGGIR